MIFRRGKTWFVEGIELTNVHDATQCQERPCVIHNPTNHHMRTWKLIWRKDKKSFERVCEHDTGHPDPDQPGLLARNWTRISLCTRLR